MAKAVDEPKETKEKETKEPVVTKPAPSGSKEEVPKPSKPVEEMGKDEREASQEDNVPWHGGFKDPDKAAPGGGGPYTPGSGPSQDALDKESQRIRREKEEALAAAEKAKPR